MPFFREKQERYGKAVIEIEFTQFSNKQEKVLSWWADTSPCRDADGIIADGAVRSGKTLCMSLSFVLWAMCRFNGINFALCGKTVNSLKRNVIYPLLPILRSRGFIIREKMTEGFIEIGTGTTVNCFYMFGGGDELRDPEGVIVGGLGVSGGSEEQDTALAAFGKEYFENL